MYTTFRDGAFVDGYSLKDTKNTGGALVVPDDKALRGECAQAALVGGPLFFLQLQSWCLLCKGGMV